MASPPLATGASELTAEILDFLQSSAGRDLLEEAARLVDDPLAGVTALRRRVAPAVARVAMTQARLRARARRRFPEADRMFFREDLLQQATAYPVAEWRARRFARFPWVADLCCGLGGDALALGLHSHVVAVDADPQALMLLHANARALGRESRVHPVQATVPEMTPHVPAVFVDPGRRTGERRRRHPEAGSPPLSAVLSLRERVPRLAIKLSPAARDPDLDGVLGDLPHEREYVSLAGECRELVVWIGDWAGPSRRASVLPAGLTLTGTGAEQCEVRSEGSLLYEPDAAVIRAGLVGRLAADLQAWRLDPRLVYLMREAEDELLTPFATAYRVEPPRPFSQRALARELRERGAKQVILKTRGSAVSPERVVSQLKQVLQSGWSTVAPVVFLTRLRGRAAMIFGERLGRRTNQDTPSRS